MPDYQTIAPPYWKGYILVECADGKTYKYVRNVIKRALISDTNSWLFGNYNSYFYGYVWGDFPADTIGRTADTSGRIMFDFQRLSSIFTSLSSTSGSLMKWPEGSLGRQNVASDTTY